MGDLSWFSSYRDESDLKFSLRGQFLIMGEGGISVRHDNIIRLQIKIVRKGSERKEIKIPKMA